MHQRPVAIEDQCGNVHASFSACGIGRWERNDVFTALRARPSVAGGGVLDAPLKWLGGMCNKIKSGAFHSGTTRGSLERGSTTCQIPNRGLMFTRRDRAVQGGKRAARRLTKPKN